MRAFILIALCWCIIATLGTQAHAQSSAEKSSVEEKKAKIILDKVSKKYRTLKAIAADFTLTIENQEAGVSEKQEGRVYIKGEKYKIATTALDRISDNNSVWTHFKAEEEVQITEFDPEDGDLTPAQLFTIYKKDFSYRLNDELKQGKQVLALIDLTPKDKDMPYYKIRLTINKSTNLITKAKVFEKNTTTVTYELENFDTSKNLSDDFFSFDESNTDVEIIDLR